MLVSCFDSYTHTHTRLTALFPGLPSTSTSTCYQKGKETVNGSGISWAICKSAPHSRQITTAAHHSVFLQAGCPSCCPTNSIKALKAVTQFHKRSRRRSFQPVNCNVRRQSAQSLQATTMKLAYWTHVYNMSHCRDHPTPALIRGQINKYTTAYNARDTFKHNTKYWYNSYEDVLRVNQDPYY